ncbi:MULTISPECIES: hypothetical protein [unclassified Rhodococcus (in: high G+C Gram-positive bacteria)]|uniref:hypothetical protein n=1 Tax=unclassified Rhodococcus (in: high G+C Gram-positive bacteria) TaxID=192944 RepID=UPI0012E337AD|nr:MULTISPECIES: hypothetical protein [unclassified Rhodococcus (in: high G+C Gram-positive bacteria)]
MRSAESTPESVTTSQQQQEPALTFPAPVFPASTLPVPNAEPLDRAFTNMASTVMAEVGVAVTPVDGAEVSEWGPVQGGPAWSTIKVPMVMAAQRLVVDSAEQQTAAIVNSDNEAAEDLWQQLGPPEQAAASIEAVLEESGDSKTTVPTIRSRSEYSIFGQTQWSLADQARFAAHAACDPSASQTIDLMTRVDDSQQWGIGALSGSAFKGGWGPGTDGDYLVRQFGILTTDNGRVAVAIAAEPVSGTFDDGIRALDVVAEWLADNLGALPSGTCD